MSKIISLNPKVEVYCAELDQLYSMTEIAENSYSTEVVLPPNTGEVDDVYSFEAYINDIATGLFAYVIVEYETIYQYYDIDTIEADPNKLSFEGGTTTIRVNFGSTTTIGSTPIPIRPPAPTKVYAEALDNTITLHWD